MANEIMTINKSILRENGVGVTAYLFMLILMYFPNTSISINTLPLLEYGFIEESDVGYLLTEEGLSFIKLVEVQSIDKKITVKASEDLVDKLRELFPEGKKPGTNKYWRDNRPNILKKLNNFYKEYGYYDDEKIIEATQRYVQSFGTNTQLMRIASYFVMKDGDSELMTILENVNEVMPESNNDMWGSVLC